MATETIFLPKKNATIFANQIPGKGKGQVPKRFAHSLQQLAHVELWCHDISSTLQLANVRGSITEGALATPTTLRLRTRANLSAAQEPSSKNLNNYNKSLKSILPQKIVLLTIFKIFSTKLVALICHSENIINFLNLFVFTWLSRIIKTRGGGHIGQLYWKSNKII